MTAEINEMPPQDTADKEASGGRRPSPCSAWVMVPMTDSEWLAMLSKDAAAMPEIVRYNINHQQWDSLDRNLHAIGEQVKKMRRILHAKIDPGFIEPNDKTQAPT